MQLNPLLKENLIGAGYEYPINAQEFAIKPLIAHHNGNGIRQDARIKSLTGTGKTLTFLVPIVQRFVLTNRLQAIENI